MKIKKKIKLSIPEVTTLEAVKKSLNDYPMPTSINHSIERILWLGFLSYQGERPIHILSIKQIDEDANVIAREYEVTFVSYTN